MAKSVYEQASEQAKKDIPAAEAEVVDLEFRLDSAIRRLSNLRNLAAMGGDLSVPSFTDPTPTAIARRGLISAMHEALETERLFNTEAAPQTEGAHPTLGLLNKQPSPAAYSKVKFILERADRSLSAEEIRDECIKEFDEPMPMSTLYFALNKGERRKEFIAENKKWRSAKKRF